MTPTTEDVREVFREACLTEDDLDFDDTHGRAFDAWLNKIKAEAWAGGANAGYADGVYGRTGLDVTPNPYTLITEDVRGVTLAGP